MSLETVKLWFSLDLSISALYGAWYICHKTVCLAFLPLLQPEKIRIACRAAHAYRCVSSRHRLLAVSPCPQQRLYREQVMSHLLLPHMDLGAARRLWVRNSLTSPGLLAVPGVLGCMLAPCTLQVALAVHGGWLLGGHPGGTAAPGRGTHAPLSPTPCPPCRDNPLFPGRLRDTLG